MSKNTIKLNRNVLLAAGVLFSAVFLLYWFLSHSFLRVTAAPVDAILTVDNRAIDLTRTGRASVTLAPGPHTVRVEADNYIGYVEKLEFKRSQIKKLNISLKETPKPTKIADKARFLTKDADFNSIFYLGDEGQRLYKVKLGLSDNGDVEVKNSIPITDKRLSGIEEIVWSPKFDLALFRKKDSIYLFDFHKYDFINQTETKWGSDIGSIAWAPDNSKIAYYYAPKSGEKSLIFANTANTEPLRVANLAELGIENPVLHWSPDSEWLIVIPRNTSSYDANKIYLFNAYSHELKEITGTGSQVDAVFSPDNNKIIYSTYSKNPVNPVNSLISVSKKDGSDQRSLDLRAEISKTAWLKDSTNLIVASYNQETKAESIFGYNTETKEKTGFTITSLDTGYISSIKASDDEKIIIYEAEGGVFALKVE